MCSKPEWMEQIKHIEILFNFHLSELLSKNKLLPGIYFQWDDFWPQPVRHIKLITDLVTDHSIPRAFERDTLPTKLVLCLGKIAVSGSGGSRSIGSLRPSLWSDSFDPLNSSSSHRLSCRTAGRHRGRRKAVGLRYRWSTFPVRAVFDENRRNRSAVSSLFWKVVNFYLTILPIK